MDGGASPFLFPRSAALASSSISSSPEFHFVFVVCLLATRNRVLKSPTNCMEIFGWIATMRRPRNHWHVTVGYETFSWLKMHRLPVYIRYRRYRDPTGSFTPVYAAGGAALGAGFPCRRIHNDLPHGAFIPSLSPLRPDPPHSVTQTFPYRYQISRQHLAFTAHLRTRISEQRVYNSVICRLLSD